ncbi:MAG: NADH:flavin oxidoreductase/NADH oxidase [Desulfuromonadaceae bacterium]|nr:NADH:flavin oxidoreductase/NADH oxidase [Desulfuromonadaceae bacterium]
MSKIFEKYTIRGIEFRNRLWVSPMCMYSSEDGMPTDWHLVHLGSRAVGGAGMLMMEATAVVPEGRISPADAGIWSDAHRDAYQRITRFIKQQGAVAAIQLAHAGRKASTAEPWNGGEMVSEREGGWQTVAPSAIPFADNYPIPRAMSVEEIKQAAESFAIAAHRAVAAGFEVIEIHAAHGYLLHQFLSPLSNQRSDEYGGSLANRMRFLLETVEKVRAIVPENLPVFVRISATEWVEGGFDQDQAITLCKELKTRGIDLIDVSTGGNVMHAPIPVGPGYQVSFAAAIRRQAGIATSAVGLITNAEQAEKILQKGDADAIMLGREFLRDAYFPFTAAKTLDGSIDYVPKQYTYAIDL